MSLSSSRGPRTMDKDEIMRRRREMEDFDTAFFEFAKTIMLDCKEMAGLVGKTHTHTHTPFDQFSLSLSLSLS